MAPKKKKKKSSKKAEKTEETVEVTPPVPAPPTPAPEKLAIRNRTSRIITSNLGVLDTNGLAKGEIWGPLGRDDVRYLTREELAGREVQKLLSTGILEIKR